MSARKKQSNISEPTQPERPKRFNRRNSVHTLHCRSGSLNKLAPLTEDPLPVEQPVETHPERPRRRQTFDVNAMHLMNEFG